MKIGVRLPKLSVLFLDTVYCLWNHVTFGYFKYLLQVISVIMNLQLSTTFRRQNIMLKDDVTVRSRYSFVRSFVLCGQRVQPTLDPSPETFISVQCASPGKGGELIGVCGICARCVGWRKEQ